MAFDAVASIAAQWEVLGEEGVIRSIQEMAKKSKSALDPRAITDSWNAVLPKVGEKFRDTLKVAIKSGLDIKQVAKFTESFGALKGKMETSIREVAEIETKLGMANLDKLTKKKLQAELKVAHRGVESQQAAFAAEMRHIERAAGRREEAMKDASEILNRSMTEGVEAFGEGLESAFSKVQGGDFKGLLKGMGKGMGARGQAMQKGKMAQMKGIGPMVKSMGGLMAKLGPIIMGIGAVVGSIGALLAIVAAADSQVKGFNKSLLENGVQMGDLQIGYEGAAEAVSGISQGFSKAIEHNLEWGTTAQDNLDILAAYGSAGLTIKELSNHTEIAAMRMEHLKDATEAALGYSKLLGVSSAEVAANFADYMEELGMTLQGVEQRFSGIYAAAMESGFGIKRFYNMVLQATSGMSMYNVRLEEAASLLIHLGRILGQKMGGDFLQSLVQGFKEEDTLTRVQKTMKRGVEATLSDGRAGAAEGARELLRKVADFKASDKDKGGELEKALLEKLKLDVKDLTDPDKVARAMSKLTQGQIGELSVEMKTLGETGVGISRAMEDVYGKSMAHRGGVGGAQAARKHMDPGMVLYNRLNAARGAGVQRLDKIDPTNIQQMAAFEAVAEESGQSVEELMRIGRTFEGYHRILSAEQEKIKAEKDPTKQAQLAAAFTEKYGKTIGVGLDAEGDRVKVNRETGEATDEKFGEDFRAFFLNMGDEFEKDDEKVEEDIALAREIAGSTTELAQIMKQGVEYFLSLIYDAVSWIASFFGPKKLEEDEKIARGKAMQELKDELIATREAARARTIKITELEREKGRAGTTQERKNAIDIEIGERRAAIERLQGKARVEEKALGSMQRMGIDDIRDFGDNLNTSRSWKGAAMGSKQTQGVLDEELRKADPDHDRKIREAQIRGTAVVDAKIKEADDLVSSGWSWINPGVALGAMMVGNATSDDRNKIVESYASDARADQAASVLGVTTSSRGYDGKWASGYNDWGSDTSNPISVQEVAGDAPLEAQDKAEKADTKLHKKGGVSAKATEDSVYKAMLKLDRAQLATRIKSTLSEVAPGADPASSTVDKWTKSLLTGGGTPDDLAQLLRSFPELQGKLREAGVYTEHAEQVQDALIYQDDRGNTRRMSLARGDVARVGPMEALGDAGRSKGGGATINIVNQFPSDKAVASVRRFMEHDIRYVTG